MFVHKTVRWLVIFLFFIFVIGLVGGFSGRLVVWFFGGIDVNLILGVIIGLMSGLMTGLAFRKNNVYAIGDISIFQHTSLRLIIVLNKILPFRLIPFLDYCVDRIFLRRVGGGYIFVHRLLMEHFAAMYSESE